jgi:hypothetical protein
MLADYGSRAQLASPSAKIQVNKKFQYGFMSDALLEVLR